MSHRSIIIITQLRDVDRFLLSKHDAFFAELFRENGRYGGESLGKTETLECAFVIQEQNVYIFRRFSQPMGDDDTQLQHQQKTVIYYHCETIYIVHTRNDLETSSSCRRKKIKSNKLNCFSLAYCINLRALSHKTLYVHHPHIV